MTATHKAVARTVWELLPAAQRTWARVVLRALFRTPKAFLLAPKPLVSLRQGFLPKFRVLYGLAEHDPAEYLNERDRELRCGHLNGPAGKRLLDDKAEFGASMEQVLPDLAYRTFGRILDGRFLPAEPGDTIESLLARHGRLVVKPTRGRMGQGIRFLGPNAVSADLSDVPDAVVTEFLQQHEYSSTIFPGSTNTIRVLMLRDSSGPFVAAASQRFGSSSSVPADNFSAGGLSAAIDLETGQLSRAVAQPHGRALEWCDVHPDTGARIAGSHVPRWGEVLSAIERLGTAFPFLLHVGWDVVVTQDGVKVIEGNNHCEVKVLQVHGPLLRTPRVRAFYASNGVIRRAS